MLYNLLLKTALLKGFLYCTEEALEAYRISQNCELLVYRGIRKSSLFYRTLPLVPNFLSCIFKIPENMKVSLLNVIPSVCLTYHLISIVNSITHLVTDALMHKLSLNFYFIKPHRISYTNPTILTFLWENTYSLHCWRSK